MNNNLSKINISSLLVLKTLQILLQGNFTMQEIVSKLNKDSFLGFVFNNCVVSKYINTCRNCLIDIQKQDSTYVITGMPFGIELTEKDITLIERLQNIVNLKMSKNSNKIFNNFISKLNRFSTKHVKIINKNTYQLLSENFELALKDKRKLEIIFNNKKSFICIPIRIIDNSGKTFFHVICEEKESMINIENISYINILSERFISHFKEQVVIYKLKGSLAKRYNLRENEHLINSAENESITISNSEESKEILFSRLLRYDDKCEILNPKIYRDEMKELIDKMLKNYDISD